MTCHTRPPEANVNRKFDMFRFIAHKIDVCMVCNITFMSFVCKIIKSFIAGSGDELSMRKQRRKGPGDEVGRWTGVLGKPEVILGKGIWYSELSVDVFIGRSNWLEKVSVLVCYLSRAIQRMQC